MHQELPVRLRPLVNNPATGAVDTDLALGPASTTKPACSATTVDEKLLVRRLTEAARWQPEAAAAVASAIVKARSHGECNRRRGAGTTRADAWVLFAGPDAAGKRNMAEALSTSVFGVGAVTVRLGVSGAGDDAGESVASCHGRTALDRVADAVRSRPYRVVVLDGVDRADSVVRGSIQRAIECGRLVDSHGRDVSLCSNVFVVMSQWSPSWDHHLTSSQQRSLGTGKRRPAELPLDGDRRTRARKDSPARKPLPLDLNLSMSDDHHHAGDAEDDSGGEGSRNSSSDLTVEHEQDYHRQPAPAKFSSSTPPSHVSELMRAVDATVVFKPAGFEALKRSVSEVVVSVTDGWPPGRVDGGGLPDRLAAGARAMPLETWAGEVLCPGSVRQFKRSLSTNDVDGATVEGSGRRKDGELFPVSVTVTVDGN
jgi:hypothetical protein